MRLWIKKVFLWPRDKIHPFREISLENNCVNIIWGDSRTGKSALIPIIDYCLCSSDCNIPVDVIRNACSWFGVLFESGRGEMLLCRKEPGHNKVSGDMLFRRGPVVEIPENIEGGNVNVVDVKIELNRLFALTDLEISYNGRKQAERPSFRDLAAFLYQPQNIIANPEALFYKLNDMDHKVKLAKMFPYVLGALSERELVAQMHVAELDREIARKKREIEQLGTLSEEWAKSAETEILKAANLGLIEAAPVENSSFETYLSAMRCAVERWRDGYQPSEIGLDIAAARISSLKEEEARVSGELSQVQMRLTRIAEVQGALVEYEKSNKRQVNYLSATDWLINHCESSKTCPICGSSLSSAKAGLYALAQRRDELSAEQGGSELGLALEKEELQLENERRDLLKRRNAIAKAIREIDDERTERQYRSEEIARFAGQLEIKLEQFEALADSGELSRKLNELEGERRRLLATLDEKELQRRIDAALSSISERAGLYIEKLDVENPDWIIDLDYKNLSLRITDDCGQQRYLNQVGSASNWLSYHVALMLALHGFFREVEPVGMPAFLIIDQPSQVYFPHGDEQMVGDERDRDRSAIKKAFRLMSDFIEESHSFQLIVTEHAGKDIWGDFPNVNEVECWQADGAKLVPDDWLR